MVSLKARFFILVLKLMQRKKAMLSVENYHATIKERRETKGDYRPNEKIRARLDIQESEIGGFPTYIVKPKGCEKPAHYVYYLHGGAYTFEIIPLHWGFVADMAEYLNAAIMVPIYPLAPEHKVDAVLEYAHKAYQEFEEDFAGDKPVHMLGDSAGAGMLVALTQQMVSIGWTPAATMNLISPFVDTVLDDPAVAALDPNDPWLSAEGLREAGRLYAGDIDVNDHRVNPIDGSMEGFPPTNVYIGSRDILQPSAKLLTEKIIAARGNASYHEYKGMFHCWACVPAPESSRARRLIKASIESHKVSKQ
jgi:monoterpene epsilon-lactone hydrolase